MSRHPSVINACSAKNWLRARFIWRGLDGKVRQVNFDQRSLRLNFEISLIVYNVDFCSKLETLIESYLAQSDYINPEIWAERPRWHRYLENAAHLTSPLL